MSLIVANCQDREIPAKPPESRDMAFKKNLAYIGMLDKAYSPEQKKTLGYQRIVKKEAFNSLNPRQQRTIYQALGYEECEIQKLEKARAKERLNEVVHAYKKYSAKPNKTGISYTETEIHQMLKKLQFKDREIDIARRYVRQECEQKVCKLYKEYSQLINLKTRQPISEEELVTVLKELKCSDAEIRMAKKKTLAQIPTQPSIKRSEKINDLNQVNTASASSIGQTLLHFFFFVGKLILAVSAALALLIGVMMLAVFVWPLADSI